MSETKKRPYVIVVGFDLSEQGFVAVHQAFDVARRHTTASVHVLAVMDKQKGLRPTKGKVSYESAEQLQDVVRSELDKAEDQPENTEIFLHARIGAPTKELLNLAVEADADLIVVGTHGRTGVQRMLLGSVAERVVRYATCPVLVARGVYHDLDAENIDAAVEFAPEPPCAGCVAKREETDGATWWCDEHGRPHEEAHVYSYRRGKKSASAYGNFSPY